jgi:hypothetical protein
MPGKNLPAQWREAARAASLPLAWPGFDQRKVLRRQISGRAIWGQFQYPFPIAPRGFGLTA